MHYFSEDQGQVKRASCSWACWEILPALAPGVSSSSSPSSSQQLLSEMPTNGNSSEISLPGARGMSSLSVEEQRLDTELHMYLYWRLLASSVSRQHPELVNIQWVKVESRAKVNQMLCLMAFLFTSWSGTNGSISAVSARYSPFYNYILTMRQGITVCLCVLDIS